MCDPFDHSSKCSICEGIWLKGHFRQSSQKASPFHIFEEMHNVWVRLNAVIFFALTVLLVLAILCALSTFNHEDLSVVKILRVAKLKTMRNHAGVDRALFQFDIHADLRPAFHWNLKQLFVYVVAEYESKKNPLNQVVVWDKIIQKEEDALIKIKKQSVKYALIDQGADLRNKTVTLHLRYDHMPLTGRLYDRSRVGSTYTFPGEYKLKE